MRTDLRMGLALAVAIVTVGFLTDAAEAQGGGEPATAKVVMSAGDAFEKGMGAWGLKRDEKGGVALYDHVLVEDDGPGIGSDLFWLTANRSPVVEIGGDRVARKVLVVDRPEALSARLYVRPGFKIEINGKPLESAGATEYPEVPVSLLRRGENTIVLRKEGATGTVKVAARSDILQNAPDRKDRPSRSFVSPDGGKTWTPVDGEILVRLHLVQYAPEGYFISPVIDLGANEAGKLALPAGVSIQSVALSAQAQTPAGTGVDLAFRAGSSPVYDAASWGDWQPPGSEVAKGRRYLQWKATLKSSSPTVTPVLDGVTVEAKVAQAPPPAWAAKVRLADVRNEEILYTSIPFEYEDSLHPRMVALRKKYALDDVVKDANTEFEKLLRLREWVSRQWKYKAPEDYYPPWDADEILQHKVGFCVQYAIAYMQCAISLGYQTRFVFGNHPEMTNGHEVTEVWSNQYKKWIYMDNLSNFHHVDPNTNVPMSMTEVHDLLVKTYYGDGAYQAGKIAGRPKTSPGLASCFGMQLTPGKPRRATADGFFEVPTRWLFVRMVPRNNFYSHQYPVPKVQGTTWDWTDYTVLADRQLPTEWEYRNFVTRRSDWNWTINQVRFGAGLGEKPGTIQVQMGTVTPGFETFLADTDGKGWQKAQAQLAWSLHAGKNLLEMRVRNNAGVEGPVSRLEVEYQE